MDQTTRQCKCSPGQKLAFEICQSIFLVQSVNIQIMSFKLPMDCLIHINIGLCVFFQVDSYYFSARTPCSKYNVFLHVDSSCISLKVDSSYFSKYKFFVFLQVDSLYFSARTPCIYLSVESTHLYTRTVGIRPENACLPSNWLRRRGGGRLD